MKLLIIQNFSKSCLFTVGVTNFETSPPNRTISFTSFDAMAWCLASDIKKPFRCYYSIRDSYQPFGTHTRNQLQREVL